MQDGLEADLLNFSLGQPESRRESTCRQSEPAGPPGSLPAPPTHTQDTSARRRGWGHREEEGEREEGCGVQEEVRSKGGGGEAERMGRKEGEGQ